MNGDRYFDHELDISTDHSSDNDLSTNSTLIMSSTRSSGSEKNESVHQLMSLYNDAFNEIYGNAQEIPLSQVANITNELEENCLQLLNKKTSKDSKTENKIIMLENKVVELSDRLREKETTSYSDNCLLIKMIFICSQTPFIDILLEEIREKKCLDYMENILSSYFKKHKNRVSLQQNERQLILYVLAIVANTCTTTEGCDLFYSRLSIISAIVSIIAIPEYDVKRISYAILYNLSKYLNIGRIGVFENSDLLAVIFKDIQKPSYPEQKDIKFSALKLLKSLTLSKNGTGILYTLFKDYENVILQMKRSEDTEDIKYLKLSIFENYMLAKEIYDVLAIA
ncbi:uncharacterized protein LOC126836771 isoform X2 [Adelges cooleyi]|uniref:uncharacterized protein LOC126836771 isoform X2 n=1 Tax=Adelges cooleyi TaxID=133065 RepID=UPI0021802CE6|nr:uncharacterized protein LOC126836771 isoform X2 [Adelges cooleyi]